MATENILKVKIRNKYDSYENWAKSSVVLDAGEIAVAYTTVNVDIGNGKIEQHPELLMKVGNGSDVFADLPWLSAKAADVAAWAKAATKPTYEAKEITGMEQYIADYVETEMGISIDTDTQYQIVKVNDYNYKLQAKGKSDEAWADVADSVIVIPDDTAAIEALEGLVGETSVAEQIAAAISALNLPNTYAAKVHTHTRSDITDFAHTHIMGEITGLQAALDAKQAAGDYATKSEAQGYANAKDTAIAAAQKAGDDAQADVDALTEKVGVVADGKTVVQMITEAQTAATYDDTQIKEDIQANTDAIDAIEADYLKAADKTELQGNIDGVSALVGDTSVATQISTAVAAEAEIARAAEKANADDIDALTIRVGANETAIATLNGNSSVEGSVDKKVADAINEFATQMSDDNTVNTYKELINYAATHGSEFTELVGEVDNNTKAIATLNGDASTVGSVDKKIADAIAAENLGQYATDTELSALAGRVTTAEGEIDTLQSDLDTAEAAIDALELKVGDESVATQVEAAIEALKIGDYAKAADLTAALNRISQNETDIAALETEVAKKANDADLAAIAKSGSTDDLIQGELTLIFDCGDAGVTTA